MKTLLVTGFEPFGGRSDNPSWEAVSLLPDGTEAGSIVKLRLPVTFAGAAELALLEAERTHADAVLAVGLAAGRRAITPEAVAINLMEAAIPDNRGFMPVNIPAAPGEREAYFSTLPIRKIRDEVSAAGIPCALSYSAGTFVCNDLMYRLLRAFEGTGRAAGFIHVPDLDAVSIRDDARALLIAAEVILSSI